MTRHKSVFSPLSALLITCLSLSLKNKFRFHKAHLLQHAAAVCVPSGAILIMDIYQKERGERGKKERNISQLSAPTVFAERLTSTSLYLSNLI